MIRILLADDHLMFREGLKQILGRCADFTIAAEAANGQEALDCYRRERPDLVLLDVNMPVLDGLATLRALRELDPEVVAIMLTSLATRQTIEGAAELGACQYIRKDTPKDEMLKMLRETIEAAFPPED